jgi:L-2,4-diaminobutyrate decarboxylase
MTAELAGGGEAAARLAGGPGGTEALRGPLETALAALRDGAAERRGPLPSGGPAAVAARTAELAGPALPEHGDPGGLYAVLRACAAGAADPADPACAAHLHCPPLAVAVAADLAASALNQSLDSWDQAPAASALEARTAAALAALVFPSGARPDALFTTGGTEANQLGLLLARERARRRGPRPLTVVCGANAHHSVRRSAWLLGLPDPVVLDTPAGRLDPAAADRALAALDGAPALLTATAGTTDSGAVDPLPALAATARRHAADLHVDAAYGGPLLFSDRLAPLLDGLCGAASVGLDLHKLGWQPAAAGLLAVPDAAALAPLAHTADYLNAADDTDAGLPDLLGRSLRTTRRPDVLKVAVTLRVLGRAGLGALVERVHELAAGFAAEVAADPGWELWEPPPISTVLFRPAGAPDALVSAVRRDLLAAGTAVLGRAEAGGRRWLKVTLLNPHATPDQLRGLLRTAAAATKGPR